MKRLELIQQIYARLASLEKEMETCVVGSWRYDEIGVEMTHLRQKLQETMNDICPAVRSYNNGKNE